MPDTPDYAGLMDDVAKYCEKQHGLDCATVNDRSCDCYNQGPPLARHLRDAAARYREEAGKAYSYTCANLCHMGDRQFGHAGKCPHCHGPMLALFAVPVGEPLPAFLDFHRKLAALREAWDRIRKDDAQGHVDGDECSAAEAALAAAIEALLKEGG